MDQRRFLTFLMLTVAVLMLFNIMFPPPPAPKQQPPAGAAADGQEPPDAQRAEADPQPDALDAPEGEQPPLADQPTDAAQDPDEEQPPALKPIAESETQFVTLGSLDLERGYRMLVTLTTSGAAVQRAEMASQRYSDQHDWSGYLGELELKSVPDGVQVQVVGDGTPAAKADPEPIVAGDIIVGLQNTKPATRMTVKSLHAALKKTEPGDLVTLLVRRGDEAPQVRTVRLARRPLAVLRPERENFTMRNAEPPPGFVDTPSFVLRLPHVNGQPLSQAAARRLARLLETGNWELTAHDDVSAEFRRPVPELNIEIIKRYTLATVPPASLENADYAGYHLQLDVEFRNAGQEAQSLAYQLDGPTGMPLEGWWYAHKISRRRWFGGAGLRDVVVRFDNNPVTQIDCPVIAEGKADPMGQGEALAFAGVDGQYFAAVMIPKRKALHDVWFDTVEAVRVGPALDPRTPATYTNVTCRLTRTPIELAASATHSESFQIFIGPKRPDLLAQYQAAGDPTHSLADIVYYGMALFGAVARAMLAILHFFYSIVGNYGVAIIMLTVVVRGAMFPLSYKQTKSMARMQALKPEMDRINEKYKTDMQKRSQAMQELYRKHQINPLGGCLPVLLQLPIFMGLYRALMVDVELRQSPLFGQGIRWCSNLAAPDMFLNWSSFMPGFVTGFLGPYLNILPLVTVALFLVTQKMTMPAPTNEQAAMQQKMMKYMTVFIGFLFYKVASGLCLYFIASSLWGIAERKLLPKNRPADAEATGPGPVSSDKRSSDRDSKTGPNGRAGAKRARQARRKK